MLVNLTGSKYKMVEVEVFASIVPKTGNVYISYVIVLSGILRFFGTWLLDWYGKTFFEVKVSENGLMYFVGYKGSGVEPSTGIPNEN